MKISQDCMIYKFRIISDEVELFARNIEIDKTATFLELHEAIQQSVGYDSSQLASFYLSDSDWNKNEQITLLDMSDGEARMMLMNDEKINDHIATQGDNLIYAFDFFNDRAFYITLASIKEADQSAIYPHSIGAIGEAPKQIILGDLTADLEAMSAEFEKSNNVNSEFDMDAFDEEFGDGNDALGGDWDNIDDLNL